MLLVLIRPLYRTFQLLIYLPTYLLTYLLVDNGDFQRAIKTSNVDGFTAITATTV